MRLYRGAKAVGVQPGESMEKVIIDYMKEKKIKPSGVTELTMDELLKETISHGLNVLSVETDKEGKQTYKTIKNKKRRN